MTKKLLIVTCVFALCLAVVFVGVARAQSVMEGKVTGTVTDDKGEPLPGATVEISGPAIMGKRAAITSARGTYVFLNVPPGKLTLTAVMPSFKKFLQENIILGAGSTVEVNPVLQVGAIEETVTVLAASPIVDVKTSTVDSRLDRELLDKLPTSRDAFYDLSLTTPGMFDSGGNAGWMPSPTAYGASQNENAFLVNGVNTTNPRGANFGSMVRVNYNAVEEVRVVALGSKAEYGSSSGAAIDVLTKSGSNAFHGNVAFYTQVKTPPGNQPTQSDVPEWMTVLPDRSLINQSHRDLEANFTLGGPIVKDKVWFFGALDYLDTKTMIPIWPLLQGWQGRYVDAKVSAEPWTNHRAWVAYHYEDNNFDNGNWGSWAEPTMNYFGGTKVNSISAQWQWLPSSKTIFTAKYLGFMTKDSQGIPEPASGEPTWPGYTNWWKLGHYEVNGRFPWIELMNSNRHTIQGDLSYYAENFLGEHDIKFGAQYTVGHGNYTMGYFQGYANFAYPQGYNYVIDNLINYSWYAYTDGMRFRNEQNFLSPQMTVRQGKQFGFFIDDQWTPTKRLTVNLGLRWDQMTASYGEGVVYEAPTLDNPFDTNNFPAVTRTRSGSGNIFDYKNLSPRIGLTYSLTADGKTVARLGYGRYWMPLTLENLRRFGPDMDPMTINTYLYKIPWDAFDTHDGAVAANGLVDPDDVAYWTPKIRGLTPYDSSTRTTDPSWRLFTAPNLKNQFTDQFTVNLERELMKNLSVHATYIYRHTGNLQAQIPYNNATGEQWQYELKPYTTSTGVDVQLWSIVKPTGNGYDGNAGFTGSDITWIQEHNSYQVMNLDAVPEFAGKTKRDYQAFQLVLNKRFSNRWQGLASLVYSHSDGTAARTIHQDFNVEGMMITDDYWMSSLNNLVNNMNGPLPFTPTWEFKVSGSYTIPKIELDLGVRFRYHTGRPVWLRESFGNIAATWMGDIPADMIVQPGSGGLSANILANDATNPDYLQSMAILDLRVEKAFKLRRYGSLHLILDGFNLFNSSTVTNIIYDSWGYGQVEAVVSPPRKFRFSIMYQF